ncbi:recombinase family protein [Actinokineospora soli]
MADSPEAVRQWTGPRRAVLDPRHAADAQHDMLRFAFLGRTSTYDLQDPTLSIPRQFDACRFALPDNAAITAHFYDIESGRKDASTRSRASAHDMFDIPVPRDGGVEDLLAEAARPDRRFDYVICEEIGRVARRVHIGTDIEHRLEQLGVTLVAVDEGIDLPRSGRRVKKATRVLTRRVKQGVAEWYVTEMLEKSWDGFEVHTEQGYNVGKPCYGFRPHHVPHPVPAKRAKGVKKTRLVVHDVEGAVVVKIYDWRIKERLGYEDIADRLNLDLITNPPPQPVDPGRAVGKWTYSSVREVLTNPKYTGHMVWNRRARKGNGHNRINPVTEWVWSTHPVHQALIDLETYIQAQQVAEHRERSRTAPGRNTDPKTKRVYRLRSFITCELCGRRMFGNNMKNRHTYYACSPKKTWRPAAHPTILRAREDALLDLLETFLNKWVFGAYRRDLLDRNLKTLADTHRRDHTERVTALQRAIADTHTRNKNLLRTLEVSENINEDLVRDINDRRAELKAERTALEEQLADVQDLINHAPSPELLDQLPVGTIQLDDLPEHITRRLFEALRLQITYNHDTRTATYTITLIGHSIQQVATEAADNVIPFPRPAAHDEALTCEPAGQGVDGLRGAPGRIRTCAPASGGRCSIP